MIGVLHDLYTSDSVGDLSSKVIKHKKKGLVKIGKFLKGAIFKGGKKLKVLGKGFGKVSGKGSGKGSGKESGEGSGKGFGKESGKGFGKDESSNGQGFEEPQFQSTSSSGHPLPVYKQVAPVTYVAPLGYEEPAARYEAEQPPAAPVLSYGAPPPPPAAPSASYGAPPPPPPAAPSVSYGAPPPPPQYYQQPRSPASVHYQPTSIQQSPQYHQQQLPPTALQPQYFQQSVSTKPAYDPSVKHHPIPVRPHPTSLQYAPISPHHQQQQQQQQQLITLEGDYDYENSGVKQAFQDFRNTQQGNTGGGLFGVSDRSARSALNEGS